MLQNRGAQIYRAIPLFLPSFPIIVNIIISLSLSLSLIVLSILHSLEMHFSMHFPFSYSPQHFRFHILTSHHILHVRIYASLMDTYIHSRGDMTCSHDTPSTQYNNSRQARWKTRNATANFTSLVRDERVRQCHDTK